MAPGIEQLCQFFIKNDHDLESIRSFPSKVVALTTSGTVIECKFDDGDSSGTLDETIDRMKRVLKGSEEISDKKKLLGNGLLWLLADAYGLEEIWAGMLHPHAKMFGCTGKEDVMRFKRRLLLPKNKQVSIRNTPNYRIDAIHQIDLPNRVIVADFECMLEGNEGRGTDIPKFDEDWKVVQVEALRHGAAFRSS